MKAIVNALTIALFREHRYEFDDAERFAVEFVKENHELFMVPQAPRTSTVPVKVADLREPGQPLDENNRIVVHKVPFVGVDGLTAKQREAVQAGVQLCRNCQQPITEHLPGCAKASGEDPRATTKGTLPPAV